MKFFSGLYERLNEDKQKQMQLIVMRENAFGECQNAGFMTQLKADPAYAEKWAAMSPEERIAERMAIAKAAGKSCITLSMPLSKNDEVAHMVQVNYNPALENCVALCIQGGLEALCQAGIPAKNRTRRMDYIVLTANKGELDGSVLKANLELLGSVYPEFIIITTGAEKEKAAQPVPEPAKVREPERKKGLFSGLFKR